MFAVMVGVMAVMFYQVLQLAFCNAALLSSTLGRPAPCVLKSLRLGWMRAAVVGGQIQNPGPRIPHPRVVALEEDRLYTTVIYPEKEKWDQRGPNGPDVTWAVVRKCTIRLAVTFQLAAIPVA